MTTTLTAGIGINQIVLHPLLWMNYKSAREAGTRVHPLMDGTIAVTVARAKPRTVNVALLFDDETESERCEAMHAGIGVITITEDGRDTHSMQYVVTGRVERELDAESAALWIVSAEVTEVGAP